MLETIGAPSLEALFACVPEKHRLGRELDLPRAASEQELLAELEGLASQNMNSSSHAWFLGAGTYPHFIPSAVDAIASRSEFYTSYTPYQPEITQGTLQVIFEWQTLIAGLTGLPVSNASLYDGASAAAEATLMALRLTRRSRVVVSAGLHPHYRAVISTYLAGLGTEIAELPRGSDGRTANPDNFITDDTACVLIQQPNFFGCLEELSTAAQTTRARGALLIAVVNEALSLALLRSPGESGADIVCGEAQSFGVPMGFGGPHLGFLVTRDTYLRQLPGRIVGQTEDAQGRRGFVLTLSTREQHIRRERATSNICTNQGLCLLLATVYLSLFGRVGLRKLAEINLAKAEYAKARVRATPGLSLPYSAPTFNEFVVGVPRPAVECIAKAEQAGIAAGLDLKPFTPELGNALLVCTTELTRRSDIDRLVDVLAGGRA